MDERPESDGTNERRAIDQRDVNARLVLSGLREQELTERLSQQLAFTRAITDSLGEGVYALDTEERITFVNPAAERLLGWTQAELLGKRAQGVIADASADDHDLVCIRKDGTTIPVARTAAPIITDGVQTGTVVAFRDMTEVRALEQAREESETRFRRLAESMPQKIFTATASGDIDYFNPQWMEFTGLPFGQIRDWGWVQLIHPDDVEENVRRWRHSIDTGEPFELEHRFRRADGAYRWHVSRAISIRDARGNGTMWIGANTDIDEQKRAEAAIRAAEEQKEQFIMSVAHDLKTPLTSIKGGAQLLARQARRGGAEMARMVPRLEGIDTAASRMTSLIDELLDVARIRAGQPPDLTRETVNLIALTRSVIAAHEERGTHRFVLGSTEPELVGEWDALQLERVLENFLSNASKYSPAGSTITIAAAREEGRNGAWATLTVADTGIGIPAADLPRISERFYRASNARSVEGSGIGLAGAKQIIEQHGGILSIASEEGKGTTITVRLPSTSESGFRRH